ncbi:hypothetical protein [Nitratireductor arenosus]|uniref:hypothetical protein n=1 Tax=Nitratireductor arenosus TaxID=2682096 RepID=UPI0018D1FA5C|nr:hypothetical protein [Nitratireductor arenosus]
MCESTLRRRRQHDRINAGECGKGGRLQFDEQPVRACEPLGCGATTVSDHVTKPLRKALRIAVEFGADQAAAFGLAHQKPGTAGLARLPARNRHLAQRRAAAREPGDQGLIDLDDAGLALASAAASSSTPH